MTPIEPTKPKVSAIISAYYAERYLAGRLENLKTQDVPGGLEIIVVAKRGSREVELATLNAPPGDIVIMQEGESRGVHAVEPGILIIETEDIPTVYHAWNLAVQQARGDYVTNANSDDRHYPGALAALAAALDENPKYDLAYFNVARVKEVEVPAPAPDATEAQRLIMNGLGELAGDLRYSQEIKQVGTFNWLEGGLQELYWQGCFLGPMPMWRRKVHDKVGYFDAEYTSAGDFEFWLRMAAAGMKFFKIRSAEPLGAHLEKKDALEHRSPVRSTIESAKARATYRKEAEHG